MLLVKQTTAGVIVKIISNDNYNNYNIYRRLTASKSCSQSKENHDGDGNIYNYDCVETVTARVANM